MSCNYNNITTITEKTIKGSQIVSLPQEVPSADKNQTVPSTPMCQKHQAVNEGKLRPNNHISEGYLGEKKVKEGLKETEMSVSKQKTKRSSRKLWQSYCTESHWTELRRKKGTVSTCYFNIPSPQPTVCSNRWVLAVTWQTAAPYGFQGLKIFLRAHSIV